MVEDNSLHSLAVKEQKGAEGGYSVFG